MYCTITQKCFNENCNKINQIYIEGLVRIDVMYTYHCPSCKSHIVFPGGAAIVVAAIPDNAIIAKQVQDIG